MTQPISSHKPICEWCKNTNRGKLLKCGACKLVFYCGKDCQKKDWKIHKILCKNLFLKLLNLQAYELVGTIFKTIRHSKLCKLIDCCKENSKLKKYVVKKWENIYFEDFKKLLLKNNCQQEMYLSEIFYLFKDLEIEDPSQAIFYPTATECPIETFDNSTDLVIFTLKNCHPADIGILFRHVEPCVLEEVGDEIIRSLLSELSLEDMTIVLKQNMGKYEIKKYFLLHQGLKNFLEEIDENYNVNEEVFIKLSEMLPKKNNLKGKKQNRHIAKNFFRIFQTLLPHSNYSYYSSKEKSSVKKDLAKCIRKINQTQIRSCLNIFLEKIFLYLNFFKESFTKHKKPAHAKLVVRQIIIIARCANTNIHYCAINIFKVYSTMKTFVQKERIIFSNKKSSHKNKLLIESLSIINYHFSTATAKIAKAANKKKSLFSIEEHEFYILSKLKKMGFPGASLVKKLEQKKEFTFNCQNLPSSLPTEKYIKRKIRRDFCPSKIFLDLLIYLPQSTKNGYGTPKDLLKLAQEYFILTKK